ncbi:MAG: epimerase [Deltaproteobacteria bacterium HGW-Deltaproteobacteria-14]|jgi:uncharacterized protein YbjT (DUF2867 family)|nr:MAG: epimerase [Deltaproteobacteria bacterium HGW-Deltaproteobacteria-14]
MEGKTLVLGATGAIGRRVARGLAALGAPVVAATRRPEALDGPAVRLDLEEPATFAPALAGVERVFLVARPGDDAPERLALPLIAAMVRAGVRHVVNLSALGVGERPDFGLRRVELALEASGMGWTHLRPNWFMEVLAGPGLGPAIRERGVFALPTADAAVSYVAAEDVAATAVAVLAAPHTHARQAYTLTGPEGLDGDAVAAQLSRVTARPVRYVALTEDAARSALAGSGFPPAWVERLLGFYRLVRAGIAAPVDDAVARVLGRPAVSLARWVDLHGPLFAAPGAQHA